MKRRQIKRKPKDGLHRCNDPRCLLVGKPLWPEIEEPVEFIPIQLPEQFDYEAFKREWLEATVRAFQVPPQMLVRAPPRPSLVPESFWWERLRFLQSLDRRGRAREDAGHAIEPGVDNPLTPGRLAGQRFPK